jgi:hypothetical protein
MLTITSTKEPVMAALSTSRRAASGVAFIVAGALFLLAWLLPALGVSLTFISLAAVGAIAMAVAFAILGMGAVNSTLTKVACFVAAVGWAILGLVGLGVALPGGLVQVVALITAAAGIVAAVVLYTGKEIRNRPAIVFIVAMILGALYLLSLGGLFSLGDLGTVVFVLFAVALIAAGWMFRQAERGRR